LENLKKKEVTTMTYRKPEIVTLGEACHTIQDGQCIYDSTQKGFPHTDGTWACAGTPVSGHNPIAAYDLDEQAQL
jgi:hypothetical protein